MLWNEVFSATNLSQTAIDTALALTEAFLLFLNLYRVEVTEHKNEGLRRLSILIAVWVYKE